MILENQYMNSKVVLNEPFEISVKIVKPDGGGLNDTMFQPFVSVDFFMLVNGVVPDVPQKNRQFTWEGIETLSDDEILNQLFILVPELKK
jgi:hypothetical protein